MEGGVNGENLLHTHAIGQAADGDGFLDAAVLLAMTVPSKTWIRSTEPSLDLDVYLDGIATLLTWGFSACSCFSLRALMRSMDISS